MANSKNFEFSSTSEDEAGENPKIFNKTKTLFQDQKP